MARLSRLAPEEILGTVLLALALSLLAIRPGAVTHLFEAPFATPAPGGGPARQIVPDTGARPAPVTLLTRGGRALP
jgi:hypothetical protein